jgi:hypothetical protein
MSPIFLSEKNMSFFPDSAPSETRSKDKAVQTDRKQSVLVMIAMRFQAGFLRLMRVSEFQVARR